MTKHELTSQSPIGASTQAETPDHQVKLKLDYYIRLTSDEMRAVEMILGDYSVKKPRWLRKKFKTSLTRSSCLKGILSEAGVGRDWCQFVSPRDCWDTHAHKVWHKLAGGQCHAASK